MSKIIDFPLQTKAPKGAPASVAADETLDRLVREMLARRQGSVADLEHMLRWSQRIWAKYGPQTAYRIPLPPGQSRGVIDKVRPSLERHYSQLMLRLLVELMLTEYERLLADRQARR